MFFVHHFEGFLYENIQGHGKCSIKIKYLHNIHQEPGSTQGYILSLFIITSADSGK